MTYARSTLACLVLILAAGLAGCSEDDGTGTPSGATTTVALAQGPAADLEGDFMRVVQKVRPSVVEISTGDGLGSGVVYDDRGHVVTNAHVVGTATQFRVTLVDGRTLNATLVGAYPPDDLAVIRLQGDARPPAATLADSSKVVVGQIALAIGNPLGLASSVTEGIVSSTGRTVSAGGGVILPSTIQTSAPINPGNSGGALVNLQGDVIGIPTLAATVPELGGAAPGIGFAIPSNRVKLIADQLANGGRVTNSGRAALGITAASVRSLTGQAAGVLVRTVQANGPAGAAGIRPGDVITAINGTPTPTLDELGTVLAQLSPGDTASVEVIRGEGGRQTLRVTLGSL